MKTQLYAVVVFVIVVIVVVIVVVAVDVVVVAVVVPSAVIVIAIVISIVIVLIVGLKETLSSSSSISDLPANSRCSERETLDIRGQPAINSNKTFYD